MKALVACAALERIAVFLAMSGVERTGSTLLADIAIIRRAMEKIAAERDECEDLVNRADARSDTPTEYELLQSSASDIARKVLRGDCDALYGADVQTICKAWAWLAKEELLATQARDSAVAELSAAKAGGLLAGSR